VLALRHVWGAFQGEHPLEFRGEFYRHDLLTPFFDPGPIEHPRIPIYLAAVTPRLYRVAGEVADGVHVHPMHSMHYIKNRLLPGVAEGAKRAGRDSKDIDLIVPVIVAAGDTPEERALPIKEARTTIGFYGSTPNYAFQFDDLGHVGLRDKLSACLKTGDSAGSEALITDEILDQFAIVARWDDVADRMIERYKGIAARLVIYLASHWREVDPKVLERWGEVARAVRKAA
jgi:probable F420-dependent oxidoreductase